MKRHGLSLTGMFALLGTLPKVPTLPGQKRSARRGTSSTGRRHRVPVTCRDEPNGVDKNHTTQRGRRQPQHTPQGVLARRIRLAGGKLTVPPRCCKRSALPGGATCLTIELPKAGRLTSEQNAREHWGATAKRTKVQRDAVGFAVAWFHDRAIERWNVHLVRLIGPRGRLFDDDGVVASCKHVRDGVADGLGVDDGDRDRLRFTYDQERSSFHGVRIELRAMHNSTTA